MKNKVNIIVLLVLVAAYTWLLCIDEDAPPTWEILLPLHQYDGTIRGMILFNNDTNTRHYAEWEELKNDEY